MPGFQDIIGHEKLIENLQKAVENKRVSHAYILSGEAGMGKKTLANAFAMTLLCEGGNAFPCGSCHACKQILSRNHPDLIYVTHEKPASIGVDDIREQVNDTIMVRPYSAHHKIYIVDEADKMTIQAQNALLKTIEEPPAYAVILLLTTNPDLFLPTILSRCVQLKLKPLTDSSVRNYLISSLGLKQERAEIYAAFARGNLGRAIHLVESEDFRLLYRLIMHLLKHVKNMSASDLLDFIKKLKEENLDIGECLDLMQLWYRDVLTFKVTKDINLLVFKEEYNAINDQSNKTGYDGIENILQAIDKAKARLNANVNTELALELMMLAMKEN